ncbi:hypothetical protein KDK_13350 [Dictyobacter kobayashii]|uniref:Uncharacterized protein n=1 Tax=Dictyobacter kobayashii TaxID=2014872 RepID=A0A402AEL8_9CHLR|nr:hypothetical protein KDK_13350 [Dictyobacter kobayashii]
MQNPDSKWAMLGIVCFLFGLLTLFTGYGGLSALIDICGFVSLIMYLRTLSNQTEE